MICFLSVVESCTTCDSGHILLTENRGYIVSSTTTDSCGSIRCPWRILLTEGYRINLTLFDFNYKSEEKLCNRLAVVTENKKQTLIMCGKNRQSQIYTSTTNSLEIWTDSSEHFILYYKGYK